MHARWTWFAGSVRERETHARSDSSFSENDTSITRRGAAITISPSANPTKGDMDIVKPKRNPPRCVRIHGIDTLVTRSLRSIHQHFFDWRGEHVRVVDSSGMIIFEYDLDDLLAETGRSRVSGTSCNPD